MCVHHACAGLSCPVSHRCEHAYRSYHCKLCVVVQAFHALYHTDENVLMGAPTGSGKTISAELAMLRVFNHYPGQKIIYIAPLKVPCHLVLSWHYTAASVFFDKQLADTNVRVLVPFVLMKLKIASFCNTLSRGVCHHPQASPTTSGQRNAEVTSSKPAHAEDLSVVHSLVEGSD